MKRFSLVTALVSCLFLIFIVHSCTKNNIADSTDKVLVEEDVLNDLVSKFNGELFQTFGVNTPEIKKGFLAKGSIKSTTIKDINSQPALVFLFETFDERGDIKKIKFDFGLDETMDFPEIIENARIAFIGNQLIIQDLDKTEEINFFVEYGPEAVNKTSTIKTIDGAYLGIQTTGELELRSGGEVPASISK